MNCDQCQALRINGVYCHETGCPNEDSRYDRESDSWIRQRTCSICGYECDADQACCVTEWDEFESEEDSDDV